VFDNIYTTNIIHICSSRDYSSWCMGEPRDCQQGDHKDSIRHLVSKCSWRSSSGSEGCCAKSRAEL